MPFYYGSGQEIEPGDRVLFHGKPAYIEFIAEPGTSDPALAWYVEHHGGGVMVYEPERFARAFLERPDLEHLDLVARAAAPNIRESL